MTSSVEQIKDKLTIEEVIGSYIKLERAGNNLKARCPFHNEKTPSFFVSPDRGGYYCFGCGVKGDIFTFVEEFEGIDFMGALKILADKAGVTLEKFSPKSTDKKEKLYELLEVCTIFLQNNLKEEAIPLEYLKNRGLTDKTIKDWRIGYVRDEWRTIYEHLTKKGFTDSELERAGLIKTENGSTYDRFRGRIMFPIFDSAGRVVAYSGRILNDDGKSAKYLNSPQTELFDKSKILYAYDRAKHSIRKFDFSILVEGQMDLLMAHQAGFTNTVASSGTALTENHLSLLKRISNKIIMSFDSDDAGAKASERAWAIGISSGMDIKVAIIPKGYDPAELILKGLPENSQSGKDLFKDVLKKSVHLIDFLIDRIMSEETDQRKVGLLVKQSVLPYIALLESTIEKAHYVKRISEKTNIQETAIWEDLKNIKVDQEYISKSGDPITKESVDIYLRKGSVERSLAGIMSEQKNTKGENHLDILNIEKNLKDIIGEEGYSKFEKERVEIESELAFEAEGYYSGFSKEKMEKEIDYLLLNIREDNFKTELNKLLFELKQAEQNKETEKIQSLSIRLKEIMGILSEIKSQKNKVNK